MTFNAHRMLEGLDKIRLPEGNAEIPMRQMVVANIPRFISLIAFRARLKDYFNEKPRGPTGIDIASDCLKQGEKLACLVTFSEAVDPQIARDAVHTALGRLHRSRGVDYNPFLILTEDPRNLPKPR